MKSAFTSIVKESTDIKCLWNGGLQQTGYETVCTTTWHTVCQVVHLLTVSLSFLCTVQQFVLMAAITSSCSTQKGSVPEMCTPSSWRWQMRKYDLQPHSHIHKHSAFLIMGGGHLLHLHWQTLCKSNSWWTRKAQTQQKWQTHQRMASCLRDADTNLTSIPNTRKEGIFFLSGHCAAFKAVLPGILRWIAFFFFFLNQVTDGTLLTNTT